MRQEREREKEIKRNHGLKRAILEKKLLYIVEKLVTKKEGRQ